MQATSHSSFSFRSTNHTTGIGVATCCCTDPPHLEGVADVPLWLRQVGVPQDLWSSVVRTLDKSLEQSHQVRLAHQSEGSKVDDAVLKVNRALATYGVEIRVQWIIRGGQAAWDNHVRFDVFVVTGYAPPNPAIIQRTNEPLPQSRPADDAGTAPLLASTVHTPLQKSLRQSSDTEVASTRQASSTQQLTELKHMLDAGLISQIDYDKTKTAMLEAMVRATP